MDKQTQSPWFTKTQRLETGTDLKSSLTTVQHSGPPSKEQQKSCSLSLPCHVFTPTDANHHYTVNIIEFSSCRNDQNVQFHSLWIQWQKWTHQSIKRKKKNNLQGVEITVGCIFAIERNLERIGFFVSLLFIFCSISFYAKTTVYWIIKVFPNSRSKTECPYFWDGKKKKNAVYSLHLDFKKFNQLQTVTDLYRF